MQHHPISCTCDLCKIDKEMEACRKAQQPIFIHAALCEAANGNPERAKRFIEAMDSESLKCITKACDALKKLANDEMNGGFKACA